jgi:hypothetical protein
MDPTTIIAAALAAGAAAGLKKTASKAVQDAYGALKTLLRNVYKDHTHVIDAVEHLTKKPSDEHRRKGLESELKEAGLHTHAELVNAADHVLKVVEAEAPEAGLAVGIDIGLLRSKILQFLNVNVPERGVAVRIGEAEAETTVFKNVGMPKSHPDPK